LESSRQRSIECIASGAEIRAVGEHNAGSRHGELGLDAGVGDPLLSGQAAGRCANLGDVEERTGLEGEQSIAIQAPGEDRFGEQVLIAERRAAFATLVLEAPIEMMVASYYISRCEMIYSMISKEFDRAGFAAMPKRL
jgi:hypothetical protein